MRFWLLASVGFALASCGGFKSGGNGDGGSTEGGSTTDGGNTTEAGGPNSGPGPKGSLPSGYCCTTNAECRHRNCVDFGGSKMCADECTTQDACDGGLPDLTCVGATMSVNGKCQPAMGTSCVPAQQFMHGTKKLGACCTPTWNGANGNECDGGFCGQTLPGPFMCSNACSKGSDCPGAFMCTPLGDNYAICIPLDGMQQCTM